MRKIVRLFLDAYWRFSAQDGWAIASHIALSALTSLFPFLIFVTAMAGFLHRCGPGALFLVRRCRGGARRTQSRLLPSREPALVAATS